MTKCNQQQELFPGISGRKISVDFNGGDVTSDGGVLLVRQVDRKMKLLSEVARVFPDNRRKASCDHSILHMLQQRVYGICQGYEDLNDHDTLRHDIAFQTAVGTDRELASSPTLCRMENTAQRQTTIVIHKVLLDNFISSFSSPPGELTLDFDATDDPIHGEQEGRFFHGYYNHYCFLPLYVFCGERLLVAYLRPSKIDASKHSGAVLKLLVKRLREVWPHVKITFRGDSGFCRDHILTWCERNNVHYIVGIAKNSRLNGLAEALMENAEHKYKETGLKQRLFTDFTYSAYTWHRERKVIAKAEHTSKGRNPRYIVTNLAGDPQHLYDDIYCARGDMENRIKEQQLDLFSDRTGAHAWWTNQLRLILSSLAYVIIEGIRRLGLKGTDMEKAQCGTIRLKLLKIGAVIIRNTRRIRFHFATGFPYQDLFNKLAYRIIQPAPS